MVLAIELITVYKVHEFRSPSRRHSFLTIAFVDSCGRFHLNVAYITITVWEHLLNQAHWPVSSQRLLVDNENQLTDGEVSTRDAPFLPRLKCR